MYIWICINIHIVTDTHGNSLVVAIQFTENPVQGILGLCSRLNCTTLSQTQLDHKKFMTVSINNIMWSRLCIGHLNIVAIVQCLQLLH